MDFSLMTLDDDTLAFWQTVRTFFDEHMTEKELEHEWTTGDGFAAGVHRAMGEQGWIFPTWPREKGGAGLDALRARIISLEFNLHHVPITAGFSTTGLVTPALDRWLEGDLRDELVLGAARGEIVFCLGYTEPDGGSDLAAVRTRATRDGDEWVISGQKMFTTGAQFCDYSFLLARSDPSALKHKGLTMFIVPLDRPGVEVQAVHTLGGERTNMVFFDDVRIADRYRVGPESQGWMVLHGPLNREHAMGEDGPKPLEEQPADGAASTSPHSEALTAAVAWAMQAGADGRRPIDDPTVRARLAEIELGMAVAARHAGAARTSPSVGPVHPRRGRPGGPRGRRRHRVARRTRRDRRRDHRVRPSLRARDRHLRRHHRHRPQHDRRAVHGDAAESADGLSLRTASPHAMAAAGVRCAARIPGVRSPF